MWPASPGEEHLDNNAVVIADAAGVIRFWSAGAAKAFGYAAPQTVGQTLDLIVPPEYRQAHWTGFRRAMASGAAAVEGTAIPFPVRQASGETSAVRGRLALLREPDGMVIAAVVVFEKNHATADGQRS